MIGSISLDVSSEIEAKVRAVLRSEPRLGPSFHLRDLRLESDGVILLVGEVPSVAAKKIALEKIAAIQGISGIADHLHVVPATTMGDKEILGHVRDGMIGEPNFKDFEVCQSQGGRLSLARGAPQGVRGRIDIEVSGGVVILNGIFPDLTSKRLAGVIAWWVPGVRDVVNGIAVEPEEEDSPDLIAEAVRVVLEKDPLVNASQIREGVRHRVVRLTGLVSADSEREAAERDVWMIFGVDTVINEIEVRL